MTAKNINNTQFKDALRVAFTGDENIYSLYCPHIRVNCVDDIVKDISHRICDETKGAIKKGVYEKNELVGYYVYEKRTLISFALSVKYRTRKYLNNLFSLIRSDLRGGMQSFIWTKNTRAVRYLCKQGMKICNRDELITHLIL